MSSDLCLRFPGLLLVVGKLAQWDHGIVEVIIIACKNLLVLAFANDNSGISPLWPRHQSLFASMETFVYVH
jgi:hypothetical protein